MTEKKENSKSKSPSKVSVVWTVNVKHHGKRHQARSKTSVSSEEATELVAAKVAQLVK